MAMDRRLSRRPLLAGILVSIAGLGLGSAGASAQTTLERARKDGVLRVGFANEAPWGYLKPDGSLTGEAPEVLRVLASKLGISRIDGVLVEFASLIPGLQAKRFDVIATALYIRPQRCAQVAFTNPTVAIGNGLLVRKGNPLNLHSYEDVARNPKARLGIVTGTADLQYSRDAGIPSERVIQLADTTSQVEALRASRVDAVSGTGSTVQLLADKTENEFERVLPFPKTESTTGHGAFAVRKDDTDLLAALNKELAAFLGSPQHLDLVKPFGVSREELPQPGATAEKLCAGS